MKNLDLKVFNFPSIFEEKKQGTLRVFELEKVPFQVKRVFTVVNALGGSVRGQHAHKECNQLLCCVAGKVNLLCDDGTNKIEILLDSQGHSILIPNGIWAEQKYITDNSVLIVFCDRGYDESDYIREYSKFLAWTIKQKKGY